MTTATTPTARILPSGDVQLVLPTGDLEALIGNDTVATWGAQGKVRAALALAEADAICKLAVSS